MPSMRSAAELKALTTAAEAALARSAATHAGVLQARRAPPPDGAASARLSASSSATISAAITVSRVSPISPNFAAQLDDALVEVLGERLQMVLLAVLAGQAELAAGDGGVDLGHESSLVATFEHGLDRWRSRRRAAARSRGWWLRAGASARSRRRARRRAGAVDAERLHLARPAPSSLRSASRRRSTAASSASSASARRFTACIDCALVASSPLRPRLEKLLRRQTI